ncbi:Threonine dehydratase [Sphingobium herbicidovorans NBRC 16415]|uniref:Threonine dehydratase n=1 Tax=Sphingobium herbicidovorans (strain ATCC 700291 / DSM 11019 / CCUG 56400 / KCTC 2939 / LMG 18315 / NBRC 16415 / MH) TaxID=1219045 RepID=A0A086P8X6_SPHHM|nr:threonine ammonia-lyase [Sphingobium herbicidovorans]KFG89844.1 Threonine dehydratase [Sphingobium herbicidovorans NBRC 16415]
MNTLSKIESAMPLPVTVDDILAARVRISGAVVHTPTLISQTLSNMLGCKVFLKFENLQFTAAYKERGALNRLLQLDKGAKEKGVIAASAGNHAQGLAYHGRRLGVPVTIVMPVTTPTVKVTQTQGHGATVVLHGEKFDDASTYARQLAKEQGLTFVHPFDEPDIMAGQGTVALEMLEDAPEIDTLIIPVGGGGLFSGMATAAKAMKPDIRIYGVQAELYPSMYCHIKGSQLVCDGDTLAEGIAVKEPGELTRRFVERLADDVLLVDERHLEEALSLLLQIEKTVVEGAGAAGLAALLMHKQLFTGRNVGLVLTGGNIDTRLLANVLLRDLARSGRLARLRIILQDRPGALFHVARIFDQEAVNILELSHQRIFTNLPAKGLSLDVECETRDGAHLERLTAALRAAGYEVAPIEVA